jgi:hypothetical protein
MAINQLIFYGGSASLGKISGGILNLCTNCLDDVIFTVACMLCPAFINPRSVSFKLKIATRLALNENVIIEPYT